MTLRTPILAMFTCVVAFSLPAWACGDDCRGQRHAKDCGARKISDAEREKCEAEAKRARETCDDECGDEGQEERHGEVREARSLFECFDVDDDGRLSREEAKHFERWLHETCDRDEDGRLDRGERRQRKRIVAEAEAEQRRVFAARLRAAFDDNRDGQVSPRERRAYDRYRQERAQARQRALIERFDADGDGRLDREERDRAFVALANEARRVRKARLEAYLARAEGQEASVR